MVRQEYPAARQFYNDGSGRITGPINVHSVEQGEGFERRPQDGHWARPAPHLCAEIAGCWAASKPGNSALSTLPTRGQSAILAGLGRRPL